MEHLKSNQDVFQPPQVKQIEDVLVGHEEHIRGGFMDEVHVLWHLDHENRVIWIWVTKKDLL